MSAGVIRLEAGRGAPDDALVRHVLGLTRPASAHVRRHLGVGVEVIAGDHAAFDAAAELAAASAAAKRGGKPPSLGVSWLFAGGPDTDDVHADASTVPADAPATLAEGRPWTLADCRDFADQCHEMLREAMPSGKWIGALHLDEKAVHVQFEQPAVLEVDGLVRVGNRMIRESLARLAPDFAKENERIRTKFIAREAAAVEQDEAVRKAGGAPKKRRKFVDRGPEHVYLTAQAQMRLIHDLYAHRFAHFGIVRGKGGRLQHHERVDREKGMEAKHRALERDAEAAKAEAEAARAEEQAALDRADEARDQAARVHESAVEELKGRDEARLERAVEERKRDAARTEHGQLRGDIAAVEASGGLMRRIVRERRWRARERDSEQREGAVGLREEQVERGEENLAVRTADLDGRIAAWRNERALAETAARERDAALESRAEVVSGLEERAEAVEADREALGRAREALAAGEEQLAAGREELRRKTEAHEVRVREDLEAVEAERARAREVREAADVAGAAVGDREEAVQGREKAVEGLEERERVAQAVLAREEALTGRERELVAGQRQLEEERGVVRAEREQLGAWEGRLGVQAAAQTERDDAQDEVAKELERRKRAVEEDEARVRREDEGLKALRRRAERWKRRTRRGIRAWGRLRQRVRQLRQAEASFKGLGGREREAARLKKEAEKETAAAQALTGELNEYREKLVEFDKGVKARGRDVATEREAAKADREAAEGERRRAEALLDANAAIGRVRAAGRKVVELFVKRHPQDQGILAAYERETAKAVREPVVQFDLPAQPAAAAGRRAPRREPGNDGPGIG